MPETRRGGTWGEAALAGLPHVLFPLVSAGALIPRYLRLMRINEDAPMLPFAGVVVAIFLALVVARRRHWPRWAASWIGYGLMVPWIAPFGLGYGYTITSWLSSRMPTIVEGPFLVALVLSSLGVGFFLAGRDRLRGLLVALPAVPMCWCWVDSVAAHSALGLPLLIGAGVATALTANVIVRWGHKQVGIGLALLVNLLTRVPFTYVRLFHHDYMPPPVPPTMLGSIAAVVRDVVVGAVLVSGPVWGSALATRGRRYILRRVRR
jgi:hypothetical protein